MAAFISLLRGINVTGYKTIKMKDLQTIYESLGLRNVRTYVQSGNVVFDSAGQGARVFSQDIEEKIKQTYGFEVAVILRTPEEISAVIVNNPFLKETNIDVARLYVTFLSSPPDDALVRNLTVTQDNSDRFAIAGKEIYLHCANGYGRTRFSSDFFEKKLKLTATTRNWKTVNALLSMAVN